MARGKKRAGRARTDERLRHAAALKAIEQLPRWALIMAAHAMDVDCVRTSKKVTNGIKR
jgi:hypothetical protein